MFDGLSLRPRVLSDIAKTDMRTRILGEPVNMPIMLSPTGGCGLWHPDGEIAVSRAAAAAGIFSALSTAATKTLEGVAQAAPGPRMFQLYAFKDGALNSELIRQSRSNGYKAICLTVDAIAGAGNREREVRNGLTPGATMPIQSMVAFARHPKWVFNTIRYKATNLGMIEELMPGGRSSLKEIREFLNNNLANTLTWEDAARLRQEWGGPFVIKGIMTAEDAIRAVEIGAQGIVVSNHGGRQADGVSSTIEALPGIAEAVGDQLEIYLDGGVRRGSHVLKALALGAKAVMVGRPYIYGLTVGGQQGVGHVIEIFRREIALCMGMIGVRSLDELGPVSICKAS